MTNDEVKNEYFEWLYSIVCSGRFAKQISYRKLLTYMHRTEFTYKIRMDENRADDGISLRRRFILENGYDGIGQFVTAALDGPCSVLEMMIALSLRCEETIMDDPSYGNRTSQWFWSMVVNMGLGSMMDSRYDAEEAEFVIRRFLDRKYDPDGRGGLFRLRDCNCDLRKVEIWYQLCWYLDSIS
jgi:hypothetical protein